jgi:integrase
VYDLPLSSEDRLKVLRAVLDQPPREQLLAELVIGNGLTVAQALSVRAKDIEWDDTQARISADGERGARRTVTLDRRRVDAVLGERREGPLFATASGVPIRADYAERVLHKLTEAAGVPGRVSARRLRFRRGAPGREVSRAAPSG